MKKRGKCCHFWHYGFRRRALRRPPSAQFWAPAEKTTATASAGVPCRSNLVAMPAICVRTVNSRNMRGGEGGSLHGVTAAALMLRGMGGGEACDGSGTFTSLYLTLFRPHHLNEYFLLVHSHPTRSTSSKSNSKAAVVEDQMARLLRSSTAATSLIRPCATASQSPSESFNALEDSQTGILSDCNEPDERSSRALSCISAQRDGVTAT